MRTSGWQLLLWKEKKKRPQNPSLGLGKETARACQNQWLTAKSQCAQSGGQSVTFLTLNEVNGSYMYSNPCALL